MAHREKRGENSWRLIVDAGEKEGGKRDRRYKTIKVEDQALLRTTKKLEAYLDEELIKFKIEVEAGEYIAPEKMTFGAFVPEWKEKYAVDQLAEKTLKAYEVNIEKHILPAFKDRRLDQFKPLHIVSFLKELSQPGKRKDGGTLSGGTLEMNHRILKNIFSRAVEWKVIKSNPVASVKKPKADAKQILPYDEKEVQQLLEALNNEPFRWRMMITLALTTALRRGELLGLDIDKHIDLDRGIIDVQQSVSISVKGQAHVKVPKTKKSKRKVSIPASVLLELREYIKYKRLQRKDQGQLWRGGDHFFLFSHENGLAFHQERPYLWFRNFIQKNKFRYIRFHDLRHTSATLLINQGVHAKIISERLGHGNINTTMNIYGHALQSADQAAADKFDVFFKVRPQSAPNEENSDQKPL
ncbi:site-specific integrase [Paenibacillus maysiensis]|uniref:site-specific integrase n=1 Tax=Paenibacillus maysiensis TaxID=1155954 RepID=UPI00047054C9|nr:site-specific integrase [Paenibacillus maysiensis]